MDEVLWSLSGVHKVLRVVVVWVGAMSTFEEYCRVFVHRLLLYDVTNMFSTILYTTYIHDINIKLEI